MPVRRRQTATAIEQIGHHALPGIDASSTRREITASPML